MELSLVRRHKLAKHCGVDFNKEMHTGCYGNKEDASVCVHAHSGVWWWITGFPGKGNMQSSKLGNYGNQATQEHQIVQYDRSIKHRQVVSFKGQKEKSKGKITVLNWICIQRLQEPLKDFNLKRNIFKRSESSHWVELPVFHRHLVCLQGSKQMKLAFGYLGMTQP